MRVFRDGGAVDELSMRGRGAVLIGNIPYRRHTDIDRTIQTS